MSSLSIGIDPFSNINQANPYFLHFDTNNQQKIFPDKNYFKTKNYFNNFCTDIEKLRQNNKEDANNSFLQQFAYDLEGEPNNSHSVLQYFRLFSKYEEFTEFVANETVQQILCAKLNLTEEDNLRQIRNIFTVLKTMEIQQADLTPYDQLMLRQFSQICFLRKVNKNFQ